MVSDGPAMVSSVSISDVATLGSVGWSGTVAGVCCSSSSPGSVVLNTKGIDIMYFCIIYGQHTVLNTKRIDI